MAEGWGDGEDGRLGEETDASAGQPYLARWESQEEEGRPERLHGRGSLSGVTEGDCEA